jgi:hypothetical protein
MPTTRKRLFGPAQLTNAAATKYTVPPLTKARITHIHVENPGAATTLTMSIGADAAGTRIFDALAIPAGAQGTVPYPWVNFVMEAAEILQAYAGNTLQLTLTIDGEEITLG